MTSLDPLDPRPDQDAFWNNAYKAPPKGFPRYRPKAALFSAAALVLLLAGGIGLLFWLVFMGPVITKKRPPLRQHHLLVTRLEPPRFLRA